MTMKLKDLLLSLKESSIIGDGSTEVTGITCDSRSVGGGYVFVAVPGFKTDGANYAVQAVERGASAVVLEKDIDLPGDVTRVIVPNARVALAELSSAFYGYPSRYLKMIGITGTNGKTTTSFLIEAILRKAGYKVGVIGTVEARINGRGLPVKLTTPEASELQELLSNMLKEGVTHVVMEVSSHSLELHRTHGCEFDIAIYTNLTHDHLDFHGNMQNYLKSKMKLFEKLGKGHKKEVTGIVNIDDPYGKKIMTYIDGNILTYGVVNNANLRASNFDRTLDQMRFDLEAHDSRFKIGTSLIGVHNAYNIMAALLCGKVFGLSYEQMKVAVEELKYIPGRFERINAGQKFPVIIDFAHSPDSLTRLLETVRPLIKGMLILVFGCPGERDRTKRPVMGDIAVKMADFTYITTDDPHGEPPDRIIAEIEAGVVGAGGEYGKNYLKIEDRRTAIEQALHLACPDDIVVIAGRGHERFQDYKGVKIQIDDREVAREVLSKKH
ncbi:MAG: UDP-N-acetylmuramoyl-L-alanyl-D-glutamate--2,6-diaminopimelate ligase [bacterium]